MSFGNLLARPRTWLAALGVLAPLLAVVVSLAFRPAGPPVLDADVLAADPRAYAGAVVLAGEWLTAGPCERGYMVVELRGQGGARVACHFEDVPAADRGELEKRLLRYPTVQVLGHPGVEGGQAVLRGCRLLD